MEVLHEWTDDRGNRRRIVRSNDFPDCLEVWSESDSCWWGTRCVDGLLDSLKRNDSKGYTNTVNPSQPNIIETEAGTFLIQDGNVYKWDGVRWALTERDDLIFDTPDKP